MKFKNALAGVKKLFASEIVSIIAAILSLVSVIIIAASKGNEGLVAGAATLTLVSGIALIVALVFQLIGLHQGGKDQVEVHYAFWFVIFSIVLLIAGTAMSQVNNDIVKNVGKYFSIASNVAVVISLEYTLIGYSDIAKRAGSETMYARGRFLAICVLVLFAVSIVMDLYSNILSSNALEWIKTTVLIAGIVAAVAELVVYVLVVVYYYKSIKLLSK